MNYISTKGMPKIEWLLERQKGIGGSDVAAVMGVNPWRTALDVYYEKISEEPIERPETLPMKYGRYVEGIVAKFYAEQSGNIVHNDNKIRIHPKYNFLRANIDRIIITEGKFPGILEVKSTSFQGLKKWDDGDYPLPAWLQMQHYFGVSGYDWGAFAIIADNREFRVFNVHPDKELIALIEEGMIKFWQNHVMKRIPPPPCTVNEVYKLYPNSDPSKTITCDESTAAAINRLKDVRESLKPLENEKESLETEIKCFMKDAETLTDMRGNQLITWKQSRGFLKLNDKKLAEEEPEIYQRYCEQIPGNRRFLIKF